MSLVSPGEHLAVMAGLFAIAGAAFLLERTRIGGHLTGAVIAILGAIAAANLGLIPHAAPAYDFVFTYLVPVLIPLFLFQADLRRLFRECARMTVAFGVAALGTVAGVTVAALLLDLGGLGAAAGLAPADREPAVAGLFTSTYIGGSVNYAALGEITGLNRDASFFSAATAADNLFSAVYLGFLALAPGWRWLARRFPAHRESGAEAAGPAPPVTAATLCLALATSLVLVAVTDALVAAFALEGWRYVLLSALALVLATALPGLHERLAGSFELGVALSFVFFAAIAAGADVPAMLAVAPLLIALVLILLSLHALVTFSLGRLLGLTVPELVTASNAAVLGATTAPALAATRGWHSLVTPGVLVGVLGYALGTFLGTIVYRYWGVFL
ncbi:MAG: DUF819 family protein [Pseudohaliea sp.]